MAESADSLTCQHHDILSPFAENGAFYARCKKCKRQKSYPIPTDDMWNKFSRLPGERAIEKELKEKGL